MTCGNCHDGSAINTVTRPLFVRVSDLPEETQACYAIEGLMVEGARVVLAGPPGGGKTWFALEMLTALSNGHPFLGHFAVNRPRPALMVDEESGPARLGNRFRRLAAGSGLSLENLHIWVCSMMGLRFDEQNMPTIQTIQMIRRTAQENSANTLLIDSLIRTHRGNENAAQDMSRIFAQIETVRNTLPNVVIVTHARKPSLMHGRDTGWSQVRGSGDIVAWADACFFIEAKGQGRYRVECLKFRDGPIPEPFEFRIEGNPPSPVRLVYTGRAAPVLRQLEEACQQITELLSRSPDSEWRRREIAQSLPEIPDKALTRALGELVDGGRIGRVRKGIYQAIRPQDE